MPKPLYPKPEPGKHPKWARPLAFEGTKTVFGSITVVLLLFSVSYGIWQINAPNFIVQTKNAGVSVGVIDGTKASSGVIQVRGQEESRSLSHGGIFKVAILVFWIIAPPIWFWFEYVGLYRYDDQTKREESEQFKYTQDLSSKVWLALVTALTILYFGKDIKT